MRLFGRNPVIERLRSRPESIRTLYIQQGLSDTENIRRKARQAGVPIVIVPRTKMDKMARSHNSQGILLDVDDFDYMPYGELLETAVQKKRALIFIDQLTDVQNLGAIIRSAGCFGHFSIVLPTHNSVKITEAVLRIASGGENHVHIAQVSNLANAMKQAKEEGFHLAGTVVKGGVALGETQLPFPIGFVIGSEQKGLRDVIRKHIDLELTIPMYIERLSFNAAHAATILCYEINRQKRLKKNG